MAFQIESTERVDDRRNKRYGRSVSVYIGASRDADELPTVNVAAVAPEVSRRLKDSELPGHPRIYASGMDGYHVLYFIKARRPSEILSEHQARLQVERDVPDLESLIREVEHQYHRSRYHRQVAEGASKLLQWAIYHLEESAKDQTRYKQRRAALDAELREEAVAQRKHFLKDETLERVAEKHGYGPDVIQAARNALSEECIRENIGGDRVFGILDVRVTAEDVAQEDS